MWNPCVRVSTVGRRRTRHRGGTTGLGPEQTGKGRTTGMTDATLDLATVWDQIRERLATSLSPQQNAMLNLTRPLGLVEDTAVLAAPNEFTQTVLESRMRRVLAEALSEQFGRDIRVAVQLEDAPERSEERDEEPIRRPWSAVEAQRAADDEAQRERADDGRSAFGVRTDAVGLPPWDRGPAEETAETDDLPAARPIDRGAPEDWSSTATVPAPAEADGPDADVLPFDLDLPEGRGRGRRSDGARATAPRTDGAFAERRPA